MKFFRAVKECPRKYRIGNEGLSQELQIFAMQHNITHTHINLEGSFGEEEL
jgi:hypothetical protein